MKIKNCIAFFALVAVICTPCFASVKGEVRRGNVLYNKEQFDEALQHYENAVEDEPDSDVVNFNLGAALYKTGDYKKSIEHFEKALVSEDEALEQKSQYNSGNAKYKYGMGFEDFNIQGAVKLVEDALGHYERALVIDENDEDARFNYDFVKKRLEELIEKMNQPSGANGSKQGQKSQDSSSSDNQEQGSQQDEQSKVQQEQAQQDETSSQEDQNQSRSNSEKQEAEAAGQEDSKEQDMQEMSKEQALMLLQSYSQSEEPQELYKGKIPVRDLPAVLKDW